MKATLRFDPRDYDYGPATEAIRTIFDVLTSIDWFEPTSESDVHVDELFRQHQRLAHVHQPDLFPDRIDTRVVTGGRAELAAWCQRVQSNRHWDWKFGALKVLGHGHRQARRWSPEREMAHVPAGPPRPGDLFVRIPDPSGGEHVLWNSVLPTLGALATGAGDLERCARFYFDWALTDAQECITWQLAEGSSDLTGIRSCHSSTAIAPARTRSASLATRWCCSGSRPRPDRTTGARGFVDLVRDLGY